MVNISSGSSEHKRIPRWYFGGLSSGMAAGITHPLDLVKVVMQTPGAKNPTFINVALRIVRNDGLFGLYNGISASLLRQATYSVPRFGIYEVYKNVIAKGRSITFGEQLVVAGVSGYIGGVTGQPADLINVRMQNDMKRLPADRRNYKNCFDGLIRIIREGGIRELYSGWQWMASRAALVTVGQAVGYDRCKAAMLSSGWFEDVPTTHLMAGVGAASFVVSLCQPFDVVKTRLQNAAPGQYKNSMAVISELLTNPDGTVQKSFLRRILSFGNFFKGITPAFIRVGPHTVLLFMIKEQLIIYFGYEKN